MEKVKKHWVEVTVGSTALTIIIIGGIFLKVLSDSNNNKNNKTEEDEQKELCAKLLAEYQEACEDKEMRSSALRYLYKRGLRKCPFEFRKVRMVPGGIEVDGVATDTQATTTTPPGETLGGDGGRTPMPESTGNTPQARTTETTPQNVTTQTATSQGTTQTTTAQSTTPPATPQVIEPQVIETQTEVPV